VITLESGKNGVNKEKEEVVSEAPDFKSLLEQVDKLESELESERKKNAEQINRMKYLQADLINFQRQTDRLISEARNETRLTWILEIISIKEDLERALKSATEDSVLTEGLKLLEARIASDLRTEGVDIVKAKTGTVFDPKFHEAVGYRETDEMEEGTVMSVIANGYTIDGKVVRPAMVEVAKRIPPSKKEAGTEELSPVK
jgi:molecular chaperone GrpE